jgi:hypothetical protein
MNNPRQMPAAVGHDGVVRIADTQQGKKGSGHNGDRRWGGIV